MKFIVILLVYTLLCGISFAAHTVSLTPAEKLVADKYIQKALEDNAWESTRWLRLGHYRKNLFGGYTSEIDRGYFFLSPTGKTDPKSELEYTIAALLAEESHHRKLIPEDSIDFHPLVKFPARLQFLQEVLGVQDDKLPNVDRGRFLRWIGSLDAESISMIFASAYMGNPASMMGHTFLRINTKGKTGKKEILNYAVNYAANPGEINPLTYTISGMLGGFNGTYSLLPYYYQLQSYSNIESRDIWEYTINLNQREVDLLLAHLWELGSMGMDYYFFTENCTYNLLTLMEVTRDSMDISQEYFGGVIPIEVVKNIAEKNLIIDPKWRPSIMTKFFAELDQLSDTNQELVTDLISQDSIKYLLQGTDSTDLISSIDVALDYVQYKKRNTEDSVKSEFWKRRQRELLMHRKTSNSKRHKTDYASIVPHTPPTAGHPSFQLTLGYGIEHFQSYFNVMYRHAYHDLNADSRGFLPGSQIEVMKFNLRYIPHNESLFSNRTSSNSVYLENIRFFHLQTISKHKGYFSDLPWRIDIYADRPDLDYTGEELTLGVEGGIGRAYGLPFIYDGVVFGFMQGNARLCRFNSEKANIGPSLYSGMLLNFIDELSLLLDGSYYYPLLGAYDSEYSLNSEIRISLNKKSDLRIGGGVINDKGLFNFRYNHYF